MSDIPKLKKARTCAGCWAYDDTTANKFTGGCVLGFSTEQLPNDKHDVGRMGSGQYWTFICKPAEPCYKPMTSRQYISAMKFKHDYK